MLVIRVELWPGGSIENRRVIAEMNIANISNLAERSDYRVIATEDPSDITGLVDGLNENFVVQNHLRRQSVWALVGRAAGMAAMHDGMRRVGKEVKEEHNAALDALVEQAQELDMGYGEKNDV